MGNGFKENSRTRETKEQKNAYNDFYNRVFKSKEQKSNQQIRPKKQINGYYLNEYVEFLHELIGDMSMIDYKWINNEH